MDTKVRVRFAPSPTGPLHMGGVRTALYNYLFAKKHGGDFILRIEDTDQTRYVPGAEDYIQESLKWCQFEPDESPTHGGAYGPYRQSDRKHLYKAYADQLIENGQAYYAFDTSEELDEMREQAKKAKMPNWQYNSITRNSMKNSISLPEDEVAKRIENGDPYVIRLKVPRNEEIRFHDEIRSWVVVNSSNIDDKVLFKSDGMPTYHLANVVDDHLMEITHVIRGEEWLPSAPLHILLYRAFGWEETMPKFAHLPLLLKPDGNGKLSKRDGDRLGFPVFPLQWTDPKTGDISSGYREQGYFNDAFVNMLAFLGWNPGTNQEIFSMTELIEAFDLSRVSKAGAKFDLDKTKWYQAQYLRAKDNTALAELLKPYLNASFDNHYLATACGLIKERATFIKDIAVEGAYLFTDDFQYNEKITKKKWNDESKVWLNDLTQAFDRTDYTAEALEGEFKGYMEANNLKFGQIGPVLRLAVTGAASGPSLFEICALLGKEKTNSRITKAIETLG